MLNGIRNELRIIHFDCFLFLLLLALVNSLFEKKATEGLQNPFVIRNHFEIQTEQKTFIIKLTGNSFDCTSLL